MDVVLALVPALVATGGAVTYRRRRQADQRRAMRDLRRQEQQAVWDRHMAGKPPGPGHYSSLT